VATGRIANIDLRRGKGERGERRRCEIGVAHSGDVETIDGRDPAGKQTGARTKDIVLESRFRINAHIYIPIV